LMIFLAVTMGFIAENVREHIAEHKNAKILAESMFEDLKNDTASLHALIAFSNKKLIAVDSILVMMHSPRKTWNDTSFHANMAFTVVLLPFTPTDGTYAQMKTSGALRYFNQALVNLMNGYDVQSKKTIYRDVVEDKGTWILADLNFNILNLEVLSDIRFNRPVTHERYIKMDDKATIDKFINLVVMNKTFRIRAIQEYKQQLNIGVNLMDALQKEYHLE
jgi:hypothetical protein